jgi:hypothetical protein
MYAAQHALEKRDSEAAIRYLEQVVGDVKE